MKLLPEPVSPEETSDTHYYDNKEIAFKPEGYVKREIEFRTSARDYTPNELAERANMVWDEEEEEEMEGMITSMKKNMKTMNNSIRELVNDDGMISVANLISQLEIWLAELHEINREHKSAHFRFEGGIYIISPIAGLLGCQSDIQPLKTIAELNNFEYIPEEDPLVDVRIFIKDGETECDDISSFPIRVPGAYIVSEIYAQLPLKMLRHIKELDRFSIKIPAVRIYGDDEASRENIILDLNLEAAQTCKPPTPINVFDVLVEEIYDDYYRNSAKT